MLKGFFLFSKIIPINNRKFGNGIYYISPYIVTSVTGFFRLTTEKAVILNRIRTFFALFNKYGSNRGYYRTYNDRTLRGYKETFINQNGRAYNINRTWNVYRPSLT